MRRILLILCVCLIAAAALSACGGSSTSATEAPDGAMTPVEDEAGNTVGYERKYHNDNGDITRWDVYDADEQYDHYILYEYDSGDRLAKETYYQANGIGAYYYAYSYTADGVLAEKDYVNAKEGSTRTLCDENGDETQRFTYDRDDQLIRYEVFENGAWTESELPTQPDETENPTA